MTEKKTKPAESGAPPTSDNANKKRKILADLHSGMVLLARFAQAPEDGDDQGTGSKRSREVRRALKVPAPTSKHRWN